MRMSCKAICIILSRCKCTWFNFIESPPSDKLVLQHLRWLYVLYLWTFKDFVSLFTLEINLYGVINCTCIFSITISIPFNLFKLAKLFIVIHLGPVLYIRICDGMVTYRLFKSINWLPYHSSDQIEQISGIFIKFSILFKYFLFQKDVDSHIDRLNVDIFFID